MGMMLPGFVPLTMRRRRLLLSTFCPLMATMTSSSCTPAFSAGESAPTIMTTAPPCSFILSRSAIVASKSAIWTPRKPRLTTPSSSRSSTMFMAMLIGMAKPMPAFMPERDKMAVLMPMTRPRESTSGPPELPGLMEASVWMKSS